MPGRYSTDGTMALIAADSVLSVISATTVRPRIYDIQMSASGTPQDYQAHYKFQRFSADGTGTAVTPTPLDFNDPVSLATSKEVYTVEPTLTAGEFLLNVAHNMRASPRWVAAPGGELVIPALAGDGVAQVCIAVSTQFTAETTIHFAE